MLIGRLPGVVTTLGVSNMFACGQPNIPIGYQSVFAWYAGVKTGVLYVSRPYMQVHPHPLVNIYPIAGAGWKVFPSPRRSGPCRGACSGWSSSTTADRGRALPAQGRRSQTPAR